MEHHSRLRRSFTPSSDAAAWMVSSCAFAASEKSAARPRSSMACCAISSSISRWAQPGRRFGIRGETLPSARMQPVVSRAGDRALLIDLGDGVDAATLHGAAAAARARERVVVCVVGQQSLYVVFD